MANTYKDIVITPNKGSTTDDPKITFSGANASVNTDITLRVYPTSNGTLSFEGTAGQLFSITNDLTGSIFSVNDISGIPSIDVNASGLVSLAGYSGNVVVGRTTDSTAGLGIKLDVAGSANAIQYYANGTLVTTIANSFTSATIAGANAAVGSAANVYAGIILQANVAAANGWANSIGLVANNYASTILQANVTAANAWANNIGVVANTRAEALIRANAISSNAWANSIGVVANNYASTIIQANVAAANAWTNAVFGFANNKFLANANLGVANNYAYTGNLYVTTGNVIIGQTTDSTSGLGTKLEVAGAVSATSFIGPAYIPITPRLTYGSNTGAFIAPYLTRNNPGALNIVSNRIYFSPFMVSTHFTTSTLACNVRTAVASTNIRMNVYAPSTANPGFPSGSPLSSDAIVITTTTGVKAGSYVVSLTPGLYWAALVGNGAIGLLQVDAISTFSFSGSPDYYNGFFAPFTYGAMPAFSSISGIISNPVGTDMPIVTIY